MSERFTRLYTFPENVYTNGAPILIAAGALLKDNQNQKVLVQLKLQNLRQSQLVACKVSVRAFDPSGAEVTGVENCSYLDLAVPRGGYFGSQSPIYLPDSTTRKIFVSVTQAVFEDKTVWQYSGGEWKSIPSNRQRIRDIFPDVELQKQYAIEVGENCEYVPVICDHLFLCTCGAVNLSKDRVCHRCGRETAKLLSALDLRELTRKKDARLVQEELERQEQERRAEEEREALERQREKQRIAIEAALKKAKRIAIIATIAIVIGITATMVVQKVIIPANKYKAAEELLTEQDYDGAAAAFTALGDYRDSAEQATESKHRAAEQLLAEQDYDRAAAAFTALGDYRDSPERATESKHRAAYRAAEQLLAEQDYEGAAAAFTALGDYQDSAERAYGIAEQLAAEQDYEGAIAAFTALGDYRDSAEQTERAVYHNIKRINFDDGQIHDLASIYNLISDKIENESLKSELMNLPQMKMLLALQGSWKGEHYTFDIQGGWCQLTYYKYGEHDVVSSSISYYDGHYCLSDSYQTYDKYHEICDISTNQFSYITRVGNSYRNEDICIRVSY